MFDLPGTLRVDDTVVVEGEFAVANVAVTGRAVVDGVKVVES